MSPRSHYAISASATIASMLLVVKTSACDAERGVSKHEERGANPRAPNMLPERPRARLPRQSRRPPRRRLVWDGSVASSLSNRHRRLPAGISSRRRSQPAPADGRNGSSRSFAIECRSRPVSGGQQPGDRHSSDRSIAASSPTAPARERQRFTQDRSTSAPPCRLNGPSLAPGASVASAARRLVLRRSM